MVSQLLSKLRRGAADDRDYPLARATWNGTVIAESRDYKMVEGNVYFPLEAVSSEYLRPSDSHTVCPWKGLASYHDVVVAGKVNHDGAWVYEDPSSAAQHIKGYIAFWHGIKVERVTERSGHE